MEPTPSTQIESTTTGPPPRPSGSKLRQLRPSNSSHLSLAQQQEQQLQDVKPALLAQSLHAFRPRYTYKDKFHALRERYDQVFAVRLLRAHSCCTTAQEYRSPLLPLPLPLDKRSVEERARHCPDKTAKTRSGEQVALPPTHTITSLSLSPPILIISTLALTPTPFVLPFITHANSPPALYRHTVS
jgi:hypothetical protein